MFAMLALGFVWPAAAFGLALIVGAVIRNREEQKPSS